MKKTFAEFFAKNGLFAIIKLTGAIKGEQFRRVEIRPFETKNEVLYQMTSYDQKKAYHKNLTLKEAEKTIRNLFEKSFTNAMVFTPSADFHYSKVGKKIRRKEMPATKKVVSTDHNSKKNHIFQRGVFYPFLHELEITNKQGIPYKGKTDKFIQINKFIEIFQADFPKCAPMEIVDMGCGKAYLTFALYHYLKEIKKWSVHITGVDSNKMLIEKCSKIAKKLGYDKLHFIESSIDDYDFKNPDVVISLHACNTATDDTIAKAIKGNVKLLLSAPCCQHEFFTKIKSEKLKEMLSYGLIKERVASLVTDAYRCMTLNSFGYKTQIIEFVAHTHTPKNILVKAVFSGKKSDKNELGNFKKFWGLSGLYLDEKLKKDK
ncbi:MAG: class I SAM-dependent methyltransferase [Alphaproteobacteria bacterium]|nr:MAG: hypothetical protein B6I23_00445 [Rickettsiaceae bacterium 4572_127]